MRHVCRCSNELFALFLAGAFCVGLPQNIIGANLTAIANAFNVTDSDKYALGGWMSTAFFLIGAPASVFLTSLTRTLDRRTVLLGLCSAAAASSLLSGFATTLWHLVFARALLGTVTGTLMPLLACVLGELYPPAQRPAMASFVSLAAGGGAVVGQIVSTVLSARFGWRFTFIGASMLCGGGTATIALFAHCSVSSPQNIH
jgi:predicted MFS family arabinose efflux permease